MSQRVRLLQIYTLLLKSCLRFPARTLIVATAAFFLSILLCLVVSINAGREVELDRFELFATLPGGTTLEQADKQAINMDQRLADIAELSQRRIDIQEDNLHFDFQLEEDFENIAHRDLASIRKEVRNKLKQAYARVHFSDTAPRRSGNLGGGNRGPVRAFQRLLGIGESGERILLHGHDLAQLQRLGDDIRFNLEGLPGIDRAYLNAAPRQPQIDLHFDRNALAHFAITPQDIAAELSAFQPQTSTGVRLKSGTDEIAILLKSSDQHERRVDDLRHLQIPAPGGGVMALPRLADLVFARGYGHIVRVNQEKEAEINLDFSAAVTASQELLETTRASIDRLIADMVLPAGISVEVQHDESELEVFYFLIGAAVLLIYMILTSAFESLVAPLAMMITLPLATIGAFWGLILTGNSIFNANALIGFLILLGVVVNNGIILIDYARLLQRRGYRLSRALITAGQVRVRPILITAISTILAMLPLAMGHAEYVARIGAPFAITVIGGLVAGTLFTLVLVPTVYFGMVSVLNWVGRLNWQTNSLQGLGLIGGLGLVYSHIDSTFWQFANGTVLLGLVPALTYFLQHSLRRSQAQLIPAPTPIHISIRNVVKVYDDHGRFVRQWRRGERQAQNEPTTSKYDPHLAWKIPLGIFLFYFTYIYLKSAVWPALFSIVSTTLVLHLLQFLLRRRWSSYAYHLIFWLSPLPSLFWLFQRWGEPAPAIILGVFWYIGLILHAAAQRLHNDRTKLNQGRFRRTRQVFYKLVGRIPVIGKRRKPFAALNQVSMEISSGMFGLIGPNGAGKTTLMRIICGILEQSRGVVEINKLNLRTYGEELQGLIGYLPQEFGTYENMSAARFLDYQAMLKGIWDAQERRAIVDKVIRAVHLEDSREQKIGSFSGGMKQRVGIAQTLLHLPRILVVDEPTAGLDPRERIRFRNLLSELARDRVVIFSTHIIEDISSSCNRLAVLNGGEVDFLGSPQEMVELTRGAVWQAEVSPAHFDELRRHHRIVHHMQDGATIRVRMLAEAPPLPEAEAVAPTLEDSYLWLLKD